MEWVGRQWCCRRREGTERICTITWRLAGFELKSDVGVYVLVGSLVKCFLDLDLGLGDWFLGNRRSHVCGFD